jgi:hypothetical protein
MSASIHSTPIYFILLVHAGEMEFAYHSMAFKLI